MAVLMYDSKSSVSERELQATEDQSQVSGYSPPTAARAYPRRLHPPSVHHRCYQAAASWTALWSGGLWIITVWSGGLRITTVYWYFGRVLCLLMPSVSSWHWWLWWLPCLEPCVGSGLVRIGSLCIPVRCHKRWLMSWLHVKQNYFEIIWNYFCVLFHVWMKFWNNFKIISVFIWYVTTSETEIKLFQPLKLFRRHWTCWTIFMSCNKLLK